MHLEWFAAIFAIQCKMATENSLIFCWLLPEILKSEDESCSDFNKMTLPDKGYSAGLLISANINIYDNGICLLARVLSGQILSFMRCQWIGDDKERVIAAIQETAAALKESEEDSQD